MFPRIIVFNLHLDILKTMNGRGGARDRGRGVKQPEIHRDDQELSDS